ncbi:MAG TPA: hypothetical protein VMT15_19890 [Bryobacteraceae bacterium]|nr:hypothetical protein [Bryobacteraceae bacterium]
MISSGLLNPPRVDSAVSNLPANLARAGRVLVSIRFWWSVCILWAAIHAWVGRNSMNPDGLSYLDLATQSLQRGPLELVNGYWSPGYPAILAVAFGLVRPSPEFEFPLIHFVNSLIFVATLACFTFFVRSWLAADFDATGEGRNSNVHVVPFSFGLFLWVTTEFISLDSVSPDMLVAAMAFLAAGVCCRISAGSRSWGEFAVLGAVLALGYYAKAAMLPLALLLLGILFVRPIWPGRARLRIAVAGVVFVLVASPLVALLSMRKGGISVGESGRLNYAWFVNGLAAQVGWLPDTDPSHGRPVHPPQELFDKPTVLAFPTPIDGTYPLWYDPSYWCAGAKVYFDLGQQIAALKANWSVLYEMLHITVGLAMGVLMFLLATKRKAPVNTSGGRFAWLVLWSLGAFLIYLAVHLEPRYVGAFYVLFWLAVYARLSCRVKPGLAALLMAVVLGTLFVPASIVLAATTAQELRTRADRPDDIVVADALRAAGVRPGDRLAVMGYSFNAYFARHARARVVAQVMDPESFWRLSQSDLAVLTQRLERIGVKAIVAHDRPGAAASPEWRSAGQNTNFLLLNPGK